jgi:hypothetical protein
MIKEYSTNDTLIPGLKLPCPCPIKIKVTDIDIVLYVGPRDIQWDKKTGDFVGSGCMLVDPLPTNEEKYPFEDWQHDVSNGDTKMGYADWVMHNVESSDE